MIINELIDNETNEKIKVAYTVNMWTVAVAQIIEYHDIVILKQVKDMIINNLNIEKSIKDDVLLNIIKQIIDEITNIEIDDGNLRMYEKEYQFRVKNAIWNSVPQMGAIFATSDPVAMGMTLATQIGMGYMNFRRNRAEYELNLEKAKWEIQSNRLRHLSGLQNSLIETAWKLNEKYNFPEKYRLVPDLITVYNAALAENNPVKRFNTLEYLKPNFVAYPAFWYQLGSTANSIYRSDIYRDDSDLREVYKEKAKYAFDEYEKINKYNLLRVDPLTASWALEYLELLGCDTEHDVDRAYELLSVAEENAGNSLDIIEFCAFAYLRINDDDNATRLFKRLVNSDYNYVINTQLLSGLLIRLMRNDEKKENAKREYRSIKDYTKAPESILEIPDPSVDLSEWRPEWDHNDTFENFIEQKQLEEQEAQLRDEDAKRKTRVFYQKPIKIIYEKKDEENAAGLFRKIMLDIIEKVDSNLPRPVIMSVSEYKDNRLKLQDSDAQYCFIGKSEVAKTIYKSIKSCKWNYKELNAYYYCSGDETVFVLEKLKESDMGALIDKAKKTANKYDGIAIPDKIGDSTTGLLKSMFKDKTPDALDFAVGIVGAPIWIAGEAFMLGANGAQRVQNALKKDEIELLRYSLLFYDYLENNNAIYPTANVDKEQKDSEVNDDEISSFFETSDKKVDLSDLDVDQKLCCILKQYIYKIAGSLNEAYLVSDNVDSRWSKRIDNALKKYANKVKREDVLGIIDTTLTKNGKWGMVFSKDGIAFDYAFSGAFVRYKDIKSLSTYSRCMYIHLEPNSESDSAINHSYEITDTSYSIKPLSKCLQEILKLYGE